MDLRIVGIRGGACGGGKGQNMKSRQDEMPAIEVEWLDAASSEKIVASYFERKWTRQRKAVPLHRVLPRTLTWVSTLPTQFRPRALLKKFPRVANLVAASWHDSVVLKPYLESLLVDQRGGRRGFPAEVVNELQLLNSYYTLGVLPYLPDSLPRLG